MQVSFTTHIFKEGDMYVAHTPEFDVSSCGATPEKAKQNLFEALEVFLESARDRGVLDSILTEAGYSRDPQGRWESPELVSFEKNEVSLRHA